MKGVIGLPQFMLNSPVPQENRANGSKKASTFGNFLDDWMARLQGTDQSERVVEKFFGNALTQLLKLKEQLQTPGEKKEPVSSDDFKKLLVKMKEDQDFVDALPAELATFLQGLFDSDELKLREGLTKKDISADLEERLLQSWFTHQAKEQNNFLKELDGVIRETYQFLLQKGEGKKGSFQDLQLAQLLEEMRTQMTKETVPIPVNETATEKSPLSGTRFFQRDFQFQPRSPHVGLGKLGEAIESGELHRSSTPFTNLPMDVAELDSFREAALNAKNSIHLPEQLFLAAQRAGLLKEKPGTGSQKGSKGMEKLLERIANFVTNMDQRLEKLGLKADLAKLQQDLNFELAYSQKPQKAPKHLQLDQNSFLNKLHYAAFFQNQESAESTDAKSILQQLTEAGTEESLLSKDEKGLSLLRGNKEDTGVQNRAEQDFQMALNAEVQQNDAKQTAQNVQRLDRQFYHPRSEQVFEQMVEGFKTDIKQGLSQMEIRLHPAELGRMFLKLTVEDGALAARFVTESLHVKELVEQNLPQLRAMLAREGINWDEISVDVSHEGLTDNPFSSQGQEQLQDQQGNHTSRGQEFAGLDLETDLEAVEADVEEKRDPNRLVDYLA